MNKAFFLGGAALCCLALGFFLGHRAASHAASSSINAASRAAPSGISSAIPPAPSPASSDATAQTLFANWNALQQLPATPDIEEKMSTSLQALAANDPQAALTLAQTAATPRQREIFRNAALHGWATRDPHASCDWALAHVRYEERRVAVEAIAAGAVENPDQAVEAFRHLVAADSVLASDHGNALVMAFTRTGRFEIAAEFARTGPVQFRAAWVCSAFHPWAVCQPRAALAALEKIPDAGARGEAFAGLCAGWSSSDPASLVAYAESLPVGENRLAALRDGLTQWVSRDPVAASTWMDKFDPAPDLDAGAAAVAVAPVLVAKKPEIAASWAESITDPELRASTLLDLIRLWADRDVVGARRYVATSPTLSAETRALALSSLEPAP